jgi:plastocyanin
LFLIQPRMKRLLSRIILPVLALTALLTSSCNKQTNFNAQGGGLPTYYVRILEDSFSPNQLTVSIGASITFVNLSSQTHTLVSDNGQSLASPAILPSSSYYYKKDTVGVITYHSVENPNMRGTITFRR